MIKLDHLTIGVRDWRQSRDWYFGTLGLKLEFEAKKPDTVKLLPGGDDDSGPTI